MQDVITKTLELSCLAVLLIKTMIRKIRHWLNEKDKHNEEIWKKVELKQLSKELIQNVSGDKYTLTCFWGNKRNSGDKKFEIKVM